MEFSKSNQYLPNCDYEYDCSLNTQKKEVIDLMNEWEEKDWFSYNLQSHKMRDKIDWDTLEVHSNFDNINQVKVTDHLRMKDMPIMSHLNKFSQDRIHISQSLYFRTFH